MKTQNQVTSNTPLRGKLLWQKLLEDTRVEITRIEKRLKELRQAEKEFARLEKNDFRLENTNCIKNKKGDRVVVKTRGRIAHLGID